MNQFYAPHGSELQDYLIHFVNGLDPNSGSKLMRWPQWTNASRSMMSTLDGPIPLELIRDDYREEGLDMLSSLQLQFPL